MLIARQTSKEMSRFPFVDKYLCIFCLVSNTPGKAAMVFVRVRKNNTPNICKLYADSTELFNQSSVCIVRFRADIDQSKRIFLYEINIHVTDVEWRRYCERDDLHRSER